MLKNFFPVFEWAKSYNKGLFKGDLNAGITVGIMLIPQGMAYSMLAGLPPIYGLYASTIPLIIYAVMGTSRQLAVGPVAMVSLLIASGISQITTDPAEYLAIAISLALIVGILQFSMGIFRLGFLVNFLSHPVISGFTSAAAIIIGLSQMKHLLGVSLPRTSFIHETLYEVFKSLPNINLPTFLLGSLSITALIVIRKYFKKIPGPIVVVALTIMVTQFFGLNEIGIKILKDIPAGLPQFVLPGIDFSIINQLMGIALPIALIGYMESIAVAKAIQAKKKNYKLDSNKELTALGAANIIGSFFQTFPTTGGFSRTAVNDQAGAQTGLASIISAVLILLTLMFLTPLFFYLPTAILAAVIMVAVFGLIDVKEAVQLWKSDKRDFILLITTFVLTLFFGVEAGILIGVLLSLVMVIYRSAYPHMAVLGKIENTNLYRNINRFKNAHELNNFLIVRVDAPVFFANSTNIRERIDLELSQRKNIKYLIFSAEAVSELDSSAIHMLKDFIKDYNNSGIEVVFAGANGPVRDIIHKSGLIDYLDKDHLFNFVDEAVTHYNKDSKTTETLLEAAMQTDYSK
ncbi:MAG: solute carrier family 26 protein [Cyclobacteriaceae bacterium]|nr:solute carrier family 26 protein [Cyclobacteriaceae bacterium]